eukprot:3211719-Pleurochrysis_carterae.AAC.1
MTSDNLHPDYHASIEDLQISLHAGCNTLSTALTSYVRKFLNSNYSTQYAMVREATRNNFVIMTLDKEDLEVALNLRKKIADIRILREDLESFSTTCAEAYVLRKMKRDAHIRKHEHCLQVKSPITLLTHATNVLHRATSAEQQVCLSELITALLFVSGRRLTEICNGRSRFEEARHHKIAVQYATVFTGQLKQKSEDERAYPIPLLVPFALFARAYHVLRNRQTSNSSRD